MPAAPGCRHAVHTLRMHSTPQHAPSGGIATLEADAPPRSNASLPERLPLLPCVLGAVPLGPSIHITHSMRSVCRGS